TVVDEEGVEHQLSGEAVETSVKVYNVTGRLVTTLVESPHAPGRYRTGWSAQDDQGASVASGVYYVKLTIGRRSVTQRMVQLK
ncbi:MAG TPA: FlgD immunoglobulin-like domain containing protein, partial [Candidatus Krumholzibacteria bacterium]|nr:FlgD immunoglobulin-like domain containing protein [Candidatus Krumholzibacteria bacterium]